jgi:hypothetical protein
VPHEVPTFPNLEPDCVRFRPNLVMALKAPAFRGKAPMLMDSQQKSRPSTAEGGAPSMRPSSHPLSQILSNKTGSFCSPSIGSRKPAVTPQRLDQSSAKRNVASCPKATCPSTSRLEKEKDSLKMVTNQFMAVMKSLSGPKRAEWLRTTTKVSSRNLARMKLNS